MLARISILCALVSFAFASGVEKPGFSKRTDICPPGNFRSLHGCTTCPAGYFCPSIDLLVPLACPPGTANPNTGKSSLSDCGACQPGTFTSFPASTACCQCCAGWYSGPSLPHIGPTVCLPCVFPFAYSAPGSSSFTSCQSHQGTLPNRAFLCAISDGRSCPAYTPGGSQSVKRKRDASPLRCLRTGQKSCPIYGMDRQKVSAYECVNIVNDNESCGGCVKDSLDGTPSDDGGRDCSAIPHVDIVNCKRGSCEIDSCKHGYAVSADGKWCEKQQANEWSLHVQDL